MSHSLPAAGESISTARRPSAASAWATSAASPRSCATVSACSSGVSASANWPCASASCPSQYSAAARRTLGLGSKSSSACASHPRTSCACASHGSVRANAMAIRSASSACPARSERSKAIRRLPRSRVSRESHDAPVRTRRLGRRALGVGEEVRGVTLLERSEVTRLRGGELAHGVEHREPRLRVVAGVDDHERRAVHDRRQQHLGRCARVADGVHRVQRRAALEHAELREQRPVLVVEHLPGPLERRPQRALALGQVARAAGQQLQPPLQPLQQRRQREQAGAVGGELDREREPVQARADLGHDGLVVVRPPVAPGGGHARLEQRGGVGGRERLHAVRVLDREPQRRGARDQHGQVGHGRQQLGDLGGVGPEALEAVEHDQRPGAAGERAPAARRAPPVCPRRRRARCRRRGRTARRRRRDRRTRLRPSSGRSGPARLRAPGATFRRRRLRPVSGGERRCGRAARRSRPARPHDRWSRSPVTGAARPTCWSPSRRRARGPARGSWLPAGAAPAPARGRARRRGAAVPRASSRARRPAGPSGRARA